MQKQILASLKVLVFMFIPLINASYGAAKMADSHKNDPHETDMSVPLKGTMITIKKDAATKSDGSISGTITAPEKLSVRFDDKPSPEQIRRAVLKNLVGDSQTYSHKHPNRRPDHQYPRATIVSCSDSRYQIVALDQTPEEDLFVIRNIGNQLATTTGSIGYGIESLETPLLLFVGHSHCGAIKAKLEGRDKEESTTSAYVKEELKTLQIGEGETDLNRGIIANVHHQVNQAMLLPEFSSRIKTGKLKIMGAIYDFRDDFGRGANNLIFINVNGEANPAKILEMSGLKGSSSPIIGVGDVESTPVKITSRL